MHSSPMTWYIHGSNWISCTLVVRFWENYQHLSSTDSLWVERGMVKGLACSVHSIKGGHPFLIQVERMPSCPAHSWAYPKPHGYRNRALCSIQWPPYPPHTGLCTDFSPAPVTLPDMTAGFQWAHPLIPGIPQFPLTYLAFVWLIRPGGNLLT